VDVEAEKSGSRHSPFWQLTEDLFHHLLFEGWNMLLNGFLDDGVVDAEVGVDQDIPHRGMASRRTRSRKRGFNPSSVPTSTRQPIKSEVFQKPAQIEQGTSWLGIDLLWPACPCWCQVAIGFGFPMTLK
jgi:hypothetical protein